jgi:hypothetical protein
VWLGRTRPRIEKAVCAITVAGPAPGALVGFSEPANRRRRSRTIAKMHRKRPALRRSRVGGENCQAAWPRVEFARSRPTGEGQSRERSRTMTHGQSSSQGTSSDPFSSSQGTSGDPFFRPIYPPPPIDMNHQTIQTPPAIGSRHNNIITMPTTALITSLARRDALRVGIIQWIWSNSLCRRRAQIVGQVVRTIH